MANTDVLRIANLVLLWWIFLTMAFTLAFLGTGCLRKKLVAFVSADGFRQGCTSGAGTRGNGGPTAFLGVGAGFHAFLYLLL